MGRLKPDAAYVYEKTDGITYAREIGADPNSRFEIGRDYDSRTWDGRPLHEHLKEDKLWGEIRRAALTNLTLQKALDRAIMIYRLSKDNPS